VSLDARGLLCGRAGEVVDHVKERGPERMTRLAKAIVTRIMWMARVTATMMGLAMMLAVVLGVGTTALAAVPGDPFKLGRTNTMDQMSSLVGNASGALLKIDNEGDGQALDLRVEVGEAPMKVDSSTKVTSLNADKLDDNDASAFLGADEQAASATNADEVDGKDANELVRVASFAGDSTLPDGTNGRVATTKINAPSKGFLVIDASSDFSSPDLGPAAITFSCFIKVDNTSASGSERHMELDHDVNREEDCSTHAVVPVLAGKHTVDLKQTGPSTGIEYGDTVLSAIYIPFDKNGTQPFIDLPTSPAGEPGVGEK
jgi:hypothetical protein